MFESRRYILVALFSATYGAAASIALGQYVASGKQEQTMQLTSWLDESALETGTVPATAANDWHVENGPAGSVNHADAVPTTSELKASLGGPDSSGTQGDVGSSTTAASTPPPPETTSTSQSPISETWLLELSVTRVVGSPKSGFLIQGEGTYFVPPGGGNFQRILPASRETKIAYSRGSEVLAALDDLGVIHIVSTRGEMQTPHPEVKDSLDFTVDDLGNISVLTLGGLIKTYDADSSLSVASTGWIFDDASALLAVDGYFFVVEGDHERLSAMFPLGSSVDCGEVGGAIPESVSEGIVILSDGSGFDLADCGTRTPGIVGDGTPVVRFVDVAIASVDDGAVHPVALNGLSHPLSETVNEFLAVDVNAVVVYGDWGAVLLEW